MITKEAVEIARQQTRDWVGLRVGGDTDCDEKMILDCGDLHMFYAARLLSPRKWPFPGTNHFTRT
jgi:hypothetical protein